MRSTKQKDLPRRLKSISSTSYLVLMSVAIIVLIAMAGSLSQITLQPGDQKLFQQFMYWLSQQFSFDFTQAPLGGDGGEMWIFLFRILFISMLIGLPLAVVYFIISPEFRRQVLRKMAVWLPIVILLYMIATRERDEQPRTPGRPGLGMEFPDIMGGDPGIFEDLQKILQSPPLWLTVLSSFVLALVLALIIIGVIHIVWLSRQPPPLQILAETAQHTIHQVRSGDNFANAVIRCYAEMSQTLNASCGIQRHATMTPREFEVFLAEFGLPSEPVRQLTRIFETVRYGDKTPRNEDEATAIASLQAIVAACQNSA